MRCSPLWRCVRYTSLPNLMCPAYLPTLRPLLCGPSKPLSTWPLVRLVLGLVTPILAILRLDLHLGVTTVIPDRLLAIPNVSALIFLPCLHFKVFSAGFSKAGVMSFIQHWGLPSESLGGLEVLGGRSVRHRGLAVRLLDSLSFGSISLSCSNPLPSYSPSSIQDVALAAAAVDLQEKGQ